MRSIMKNALKKEIILWRKKRIILSRNIMRTGN